MSSRIHYLPATKLVDGYIILECDCGVAVDYPGHPDDVTEIVCAICRTTWSIEARPLDEAER